MEINDLIYDVTRFYLLIEDSNGKKIHISLEYGDKKYFPYNYSKLRFSQNVCIDNDKYNLS